MESDAAKPTEQFRAAWQAAADAASEWSRRVSEATHEALEKIEPGDPRRGRSRARDGDRGVAQLPLPVQHGSPG